MADGSNAPNLMLSLIGDFELRRAGEPVRMAPSSQRLICYLALQNRTRRRSLVSSTLWLDSSEARANASLRSALWRVPAPAGEAVVSASNTHVWLNPRVRVDLHRMIERAYAVLDSTATDMDMVNVARDLAAFGDDVLPGWYEDWVIMERERFRQLRLHVLDRLGEQLLSKERYADASQVALACIHAEPLRETAHRLLVRVHQHEGNIGEAIRQYQQYTTLLRKELGTRPSPSMTRLISSYCVVP